jgi:hypothetical protein
MPDGLQCPAYLPLSSLSDAETKQGAPIPDLADERSFWEPGHPILQHDPGIQSREGSDTRDTLDPRQIATQDLRRRVGKRMEHITRIRQDQETIGVTI